MLLILGGEGINEAAFFDGLADARIEVKSSFVNDVSDYFFYQYSRTYASGEFQRNLVETAGGTPDEGEIKTIKVAWLPEGYLVEMMH